MPRFSHKKGMLIVAVLVVMYIISELIAKRQTLKAGFNRRIEGNIPVPDTLIKDEEWLKKMDETHRARVDVLLKTCTDHYNISLKSVSSLAARPERLRPLIVNDKYQFIYSIVYKVGSTNWERVLVEDLGGFKNVPNQKLYSHKALHWMPRYNVTEIQERLSRYTSFIFVRNPFARILSAYRDKFVNHHNKVFTELGRSIVQNYRDSFNAHQSGDNLTLTEFIRYLVDSPSHRTNPHWKPIFIQNLPCEIKYDIIGKLEEASEDIPYVLKHLHIDHIVSYANGPRTMAEKTLLKEYYSQVPSDLLQKLYYIYQPDFDLFGYDFHSTITR